MLSGKNNQSARSPFSVENVALAAMLLLLVGLLRSRAILSFGIVMFGLNALLRGDIRALKDWKQWLFPSLWVLLYFISFLWSDDAAAWWKTVQLKLPALLLPVAFCMLPPFSARALKAFTGMLLSAMLIGLAYSLACYFLQPELYIREANHSLLIPTPAYNNHIVFSMAVALSIGWGIWSWPLWRRLQKILLLVVLLLLTAYLHLLSAKTGLLLVYLLALLCIWRLAARRATRLYGLSLLAFLMIAVSAAYQFIPTFRGRIHYTWYSFLQFQSGERTGNYSDVGRLLSYNVGLHEVRNAPLAGSGAGDLMPAMHEGYALLYPEVPPGHHLVPHNQLLSTAVAVGIPGALLLLCWIAAAILSAPRRGRDGFFIRAVWLLLFASLFVDALLDVQFGVFVFLLFGLMITFASRSGISAVAISDRP